ncbi:DNA polymerase III subunit epsilon [Oxalicibacterium faecigallinarum]|uniref:DNA polymerase III subunit epsilon n=1 Tax=Oxalicibacterium faecigallinarum TaxID=573741 RepID=A0A8J3AQB4_9BURK|nr:DNA polymerase III subunit epsilon [Oxalicibacterium faecigallinarum]GGI17834.1 DNA polymerase III subunit epsilon [Oxalicibacterium faecigallinarum]
MRQIVLDTETTGLNARSGDRIIEIGCVEMINRQLTGNNFHHYINPERDSEEGALAVHGLTTEFLSDKPKFAEIVDEFRDYIAGAEIIIHNAPFDIGFLDAELERLNMPAFKDHVGEVVDTLVQAKEMHPGKRNSLDSLCDRYGISNAHRTLHGALLDAELLAEVYLAMTRGQNTFSMDLGSHDDGDDASAEVVEIAEVIVLAANEQELADHEALLDSLDKQTKGATVWRATPVAEVPAN